MPQIPLNEIDDCLVGIHVHIVGPSGYRAGGAVVTSVRVDTANADGHSAINFRFLEGLSHTLYTYFNEETWTVHVDELNYLKWLCNRAEKGESHG